MTAPFGLLRTRRRGRKPAQISPLAETGFPLDGCSDFWESRSCHGRDSRLHAGGTARHWRASAFLGVDFLPERLRRDANQFARGASVFENLAAFKRADTTICGVEAGG